MRNRVGENKQKTYCKIKVCNCRSKIPFYILFLTAIICYLALHFGLASYVFLLCVTLKSKTVMLSAQFFFLKHLPHSQLLQEI